MPHSIYTESKRTIVIRGQKAEHHEYIFSRCSATSLSYHFSFSFSPVTIFHPLQAATSSLFTQFFRSLFLSTGLLCRSYPKIRSHSKFRPRRDKGSEFKFPSASNVHVPLVYVVYRALCEHIVRFLHEISKQSVKTGRFSTAFDFLRTGNSFERVLIQAELTLEFHGWETVVHPRLAIYRGIVVYWRSSIVIYQAKNSMLYYLPRTIENTWLLVKFNLQFQ